MIFGNKRLNKVYETEHRKVVIATREANVWKQKASDYRWLIETYIPPNDLPLWKRISRQRRELRRLVQQNYELIQALRKARS